MQHEEAKSVSGWITPVFSLPSGLLVCGLLYAWTLTYPLNIDSSVHAYMAALIVKGYWPYVSVWENNFPGTIFFVHLPEYLLLGKSAFAFHAWDVLWRLAGTYLLFKIVRHIASSVKPAPWLAAVLVAIYYLSVDNLMVAQRDCYATIVLLATVYILNQDDKDQGIQRYLWSGLLYGIAILIRPTNELYALFLAIWIVVVVRSRKGVINGMMFLIAAQIFLVLFGLIALLAGHFTEIYTIIIRFNTEVYSKFIPIGEMFYPFGKYWWVLFAVPFGLYALRSRDRLLFGGLVVISFLTLIPQKRYVYQYDTTFVLLLILAAVGWVHIFIRLSYKSSSVLRYLGPLALVVFVLFFWTRGTTQKHLAIRAIKGQLPSGPIYWQYDTSDSSGFAVLDSVSDYLKRYAGQNSRVQFVGEYAYPLYYADLLPATRFITFHSIMLRNSRGQLTEFQQQWRRELIDTLTAAPPVYIVVADAPEYARGHLNGLLGHQILERDLTSLRDLIRSRYHRETSIGAFTFYRRNEKPL